MHYLKDQIFSNYHISLYNDHLFVFPKDVNAELTNAGIKKQIKTLWGDGIDYHQWANTPEFKNSLLLTNCEFNSVPKYISDHIFTVNSSFYGAYYCDYPNKNIAISKSFNCFINRLDPGRQSWAFQLVRHKMFDQGYVSINIDISRSADKLKNLNAQQAFETCFRNYNLNFEDEYTALKDLIPYKNFQDSGDVTDIVLATKFSIILETFFHDNTINTFSEKTFRCLQLPRPWVLFSTKGAVQLLRSLGFDVLDDIVDHAYDTIDDTAPRQAAIIESSKKLMLIDVDCVQDRCQRAAANNKMVLKLMHSQWAINMKNDLLDAKKQLLSLP